MHLSTLPRAILSREELEALPLGLKQTNSKSIASMLLVSASLNSLAAPNKLGAAATHLTKKVKLV